MSDIVFTCVKQGDKYTSEQVNILFDMVCRNLVGTPIRFVCFTDDASGLHPLISVRETPADLEGWWAKIFLFKPGHFDDSDRVVYLDLSCVITGSLSFLAEYDGGFATLRDFYRPAGLQSAVMAWPANWGAHIWESWDASGRPHLPGGDQEWIERQVPGAVRLQDIFPGFIVSYKVHCAGRRSPPYGARIVKFHGLPKPENCPDLWVKNLYRVGADVAANIGLQSNTPDDRLSRNVAINSARDLPWLTMKPTSERHIAIVGGGPSVVKSVDLLRRMAESGVEVWALNGAAHWLHDVGITPDVQVLLDGRDHNISFVSPPVALSYLIASQCDPCIFEALKNEPVVVWHAYSSDTEAAIPRDVNKQLTLVAAGSTVGLAAMAIAYADGCRNLHLFGYDSSYSEVGEHHAYRQPDQDRHDTIFATVGDRTFKTCAWMASQANEWQITAAELANGGMQIAVHGDGLLPAVAHELSAIQSEGDFRWCGGFLWPATDRNCAKSVLDNVDDVATVIGNVPKRRVAIQAGGNVGVYAKELSKHFGTVFTFEPDHMNYLCMQENVQEDNVHKFRAALGSKRGKVSIVRDEANVGAHYICSGDDVTVVAIDDLQLDACDLIYLDIEGYELEALKGASGTIARHKPVVVVEDKGLSERFGVGEGEVVEWLKREHGYSEVGWLGRDVIMKAAA